MNAHPWVLIGLGSNQGDSQQILAAATARLRAYAATDGNGETPPEGFRGSALWQTSPVDCPPDSPTFLNAAVAFVPQPDLTPERLLADLKKLERQYGRGQVYAKNAPRPLDLDLLLFAGEQRDLPWFQLPHPRAVMRRFVLAPAAEVVPQVEWPGLGRSIQQLLDALESDEVVTRMDLMVGDSCG